MWLAEGVLPMGQVLMRSARRAPTREALVFPGVRLSYGELAQRAWTVARSLAGLGVQPREHVGVLMTNHPDLVSVIFGASLLGATVVPVNARYRTSELHAIIEDSDVVTLITHDSADDHVDFTALCHEALPGLQGAADPQALALPEHPKLRSVVMMGARTPDGMVTRAAFDRLGDAVAEARLRNQAEAVSLRDFALILYTSGTTSQPRGAMITHEAFVRDWIGVAGLWHSGPQDRHYTPLPLFHVTGLGCLFWTLAAGGTFFSDFHFDAERTFRALEQERITEFYPAYPPVMEAVISHPDFPTTDLSALRIFQNVAPPETLEKFQSRLPSAVQLTCYGGTEGGVVSMTRPEDPPEVRRNTCGAALPGIELRVVDPDTAVPLDPGERGIIQFRGYNTLTRYWKSPEKTAESVLADGWTTMQDLGVVDEAGRVLFLGRQKETLKVGGENVAPQEIEAQLSTHPAVKLVQVVGIPDERLQEVAVAFVELVPGAEAGEDELIAHCQGRIASFKVPRMIRYVQDGEWPMSATKIQRFVLRDQLLDELQSATRPAG
jgi:acyl-CoA synthetase (AMP-forming)/AMP-acid ligase II